MQWKAYRRRRGKERSPEKREKSETRQMKEQKEPVKTLIKLRTLCSIKSGKHVLCINPCHIFINQCYLSTNTTHAYKQSYLRKDKFLFFLILQGPERRFCLQTRGWAMTFSAAAPGLSEGCCNSCFSGTCHHYMKICCIMSFPPNIIQSDSQQHSFLKPNLLVQLMEHDAVFRHIYFLFSFL